MANPYESAADIQQDSRDGLEKSKLGVRSILALVVVFAAWAWIFRDLGPGLMAVLAGVTLIAGLLGHVVYAVLLPLRATVVVTVLLIYNALLMLMMVLSGQGDPASLVDVALIPLDVIHHANSSRRFLLSGFAMLATVALTAAHSIRPSATTAIITSLGITSWYSMAFLYMMFAG